MKKFKYIISALLLVCATLHSQDIIRVTEKDLDGDTITNKRNVDINSQLILRLDRSALLKRIGDSSDSRGLPASVNTLLVTLKTALKKKQEWMTGFTEAVNSYIAGNKAELNSFAAKRQAISRDILQVLNSDEKLLEYFEEAANFEVTTRGLVWKQLTYALNKRIIDIERELFTSPTYSDVRVQLGGWLIHGNEPAPLHFEGLDTNPVGEFYEVERWKFTLTPEQLAQLEELQRLAKADSLSEANFSQIIRSRFVTVFLDTLKARLNGGIQDLKRKADSIATALGVSVVKTDIQQLVAESNALVALISSKIEFYSTLPVNPDFTLTLFLSSLTSDIAQLNTAQQNIRRLFIKLETDIAAASAAMQELVRELKPLIRAQLAVFANIILGQGGLDVIDASNINDLALEFSDKVLSLSLQDIPDEASTDLRYSGFREEGDRVVVKLVVTKGEPGVRIIQETKDMTLYRIIPHVEGTVGVIFAHPLSETLIEKEFQMAPAYNFLFKGLFPWSRRLSRSKRVFNTLLQTSLGIHLSSPDFDKDDVPELGVGIVLSTLKDYLQAGWAYNIFTGTPYFYFGLRLPMPTMNLANAGSSSSVVDK